MPLDLVGFCDHGRGNIDSSNILECEEPRHLLASRRRSRSLGSFLWSTRSSGPPIAWFADRSRIRPIRRIYLCFRRCDIRDSSSRPTGPVPRRDFRTRNLDNESIFARIEYERRIGSHHKIELEIQKLMNLAKPDPFYSLRRDSYLQLSLSRYW